MLTLNQIFLSISIFFVFLLLLISIYEKLSIIQISDITKKFDAKKVIISANLTKLSTYNKKTFLELTDTKYENNKITAIINQDNTLLNNYLNQTLYFKGKLSSYNNNYYFFPELIKKIN